MALSYGARMWVLAALALSPALAGGNIVITGHDDDHHAGGCGGPSQARTQLSAMIAFARAGAPNPSLPVLSFDHGKEVTSCLTALGIPFRNVDPDLGVPAAGNFDVARYSALVVASDETCNGCDNTATGIANLTAAAPAIAAFLNAGGGIAAFAGARNAARYYGFLPASASGFGSPSPNGYVQTRFGVSFGIPEVNGDMTHNLFPDPGSVGVSADYQVVEIWNSDGRAETLACFDCTTTGLIAGSSGSLFVPLAGVIGLAGGLAALKALRARSQRNRAQKVPRRVGQAGFHIRISGEICGSPQSDYELEIHGEQEPYSGR
jgi:hypothetical protein